MPPKVSVCMLTFNHEKFVAQSIESVLMQETDFAYELLIHDDASTDTTAAIVREYEQRYPHIIRQPIYQVENQHSRGKRPGQINRSRAQGEYLAVLEGDDYWTDPRKLQKQVELLESRSDCSMCFSSCVVVDEQGEVIAEDKVPYWHRRDLSSREVICETTPPILTAMYRASAVPRQMPKQSHAVLNGDTFLSGLIALSGGAAYLPEVTAAYRKHRGGMWAFRSDIRKARATSTTYAQMSLAFPEEYRADLLRKAHEGYDKFLRLAWKEGKYVGLLKACWDILWLDIRLGSFEFARIGARSGGQWLRKVARKCGFFSRSQADLG